MTMYITITLNITGPFKAVKDGMNAFLVRWSGAFEMQRVKAVILTALFLFQNLCRQHLYLTVVSTFVLSLVMLDCHVCTKRLFLLSIL